MTAPPRAKKDRGPTQDAFGRSVPTASELYADVDLPGTVARGARSVWEGFNESIDAAAAARANPVTAARNQQRPAVADQAVFTAPPTAGPVDTTTGAGANQKCVGP